MKPPALQNLTTLARVILAAVGGTVWAAVVYGLYVLLR